MVEHENRITAVETEVRYMRQSLDEMNDTLSRLVEEFHEFRGEARARWELEKKSKQPNGGLVEVIKTTVMTLVAALLALVGVKLGGGA